MTADLTLMTAGELLASYRDKSLSPLEVTEAVLAAIDRVDSKLNAYVLVDREAALAEAAASQERWQVGVPKGRLDGVPTAVKDIVETQGWPCRRGSRAMPDTPAAADAPVSARLREHGAVLIGATTTPEFGWKGVTDSPLTGITRNPWNLEKTPGGSSGGSSAALAAGLAALAVGTDGGGSIRIPAAFTGVFGIKPSFGRVAAYPASPFGTVSHIGPMARSVHDAALMLTVMAEPDPRNWHPLPVAVDDYTLGLDEGVAGLKIAFSPSLGGHRVEPEIAELVAKAARRFEELGAVVEEAEPDLSGVDEIFRIHWFAGAANLLARFSSEQQALLDLGLRQIAAEGARYSLLDYLAASDRRRDLALTMSLFHQDYDLLLTPAMPLAAFDAGLETPPGSDQDRWVDWTPFSYPFNLTQQPAASVPCGLTKAGLPAGLQIVGPLYADALVLRAAQAFEEVAPFVMPEL
jgi:aspartyl-tRNA(Asn)/glutamyl-tRNA(Gln) amidotransferase subunit A